VFIGYAQQDSLSIYEIEYIRNLSPNHLKTFTSSYVLQKSPDLNISIFDKKNNLNQIDDLENDEDDDTVFYYTPKGENISLVYKDYSKNKLYSRGGILTKYFTIEDSLTIFDWKIIEKTKNILGFTCQLATTSFRGRNYKAWFTSELPVGGPWKYDGLPGMILLIETEAPYLSFEAVSIKSHKIKFEKKDNPFKKEKTYSWNEFKALYKKKAIALSKYSTTPENNDDEGGIIFPRMGIERYIEETDKDYTADKEFKKLSDN
jgi:GLPGLI family protein